MAIELVRLIWCDLCRNQDEDAKVPAVRTLAVSLDGTFAEVDMCQEHAGLWADQLTDLLILGRETDGPPRVAPRPPAAEGRGPGRPPGGTYASGREYPCPICEAIYGTVEGVKVHVWRDHAQAPKPPAPEGACPECDMTFDSPQGLSSHRSMVHHMSWTDVLVAQLTAAGFDLAVLKAEAGSR